MWPAPSELDNIEGTVDVDKWWRHVDSKIVEAAVFKSSTSEQVQVTDIAPWIPPSCRNSTIVNTEHLKVSSSAIESPNGKPFGCPKKLADLVRRGRYDPLELHGMSTQEVKQQQKWKFHRQWVQQRYCMNIMIRYIVVDVLF